MAPVVKNNFFKHVADYSGISVELTSDELQLTDLEIVQKKKVRNSSDISDPIRNALSYLDDYFLGKNSKVEIVLNSGRNNSKIDAVNKLCLDMTGYTEKEIRVYRELLKIEFGRKISYGELARLSGINRGGRFAGNCMAGNRYPVIIPCHRVIKWDGSTGNYTGGAGIKEFLLKHEAKS